MKKAAFTVLTVVLLLTLVCGSAFAASGDLTLKRATAYANPEMTIKIGTIPRYTALKVNASGAYADVVYNGVRCYIKASTLSQGKFDYVYIGSTTLKKGTAVYQRPSSSSRCKTLSKPVKVKVVKVAKGYALIRSSKGIFGFVKSDMLTDMDP